jgi:hypothetical protein
MKYLILLSYLCVQVLCFGQSPEGINYQAVIRDNAGNVLQNNNVGLKMSLYQATIGGTLVFEESFSSTTDNFGLVNLVIGQGNNLSGDFTSIDWSAGPYFLEIAADDNGGNDYEVIGAQQLMSVPYALYSKTSGNPIPGPQGEEGPQGAQGDPGPQGDAGTNGTNGTNGVLQNGTEIGNTTFWDGTEWVVDNNNIFNSGANVGIGVIPNAKLEVAGDIAISSPFKYKVKDAIDGDNFLMYEPTVDGLRLNGYDAVFITTTDATNATAGQDLVVRNGRVGINTNTPSQGLLHVNGYYADPFGNYTFYATGPNTGTGAPANLNTSIFATHRVVAGEFNAISDARIKKIDGISNSNKDLETLSKIEVTDYHMIDPSHGTKPIKKVIAQELEKTYPQAVSKSTNCIPDIYALADCNSGTIQIKNDLSPGERIRLIFESKEEIATVISASPNDIKTDLSLSGNVFVYGREVDDFRTVDYQAVSMLNVSATQALLKRIEALEKENETLKRVDNNMHALKAEFEVLQKSVLLLINEGSTASNPK